MKIDMRSIANDECRVLLAVYEAAAAVMENSKTIRPKTIELSEGNQVSIICLQPNSTYCFKGNSKTIIVTTGDTQRAYGVDVVPLLFFSCSNDNDSEFKWRIHDPLIAECGSKLILQDQPDRNEKIYGRIANEYHSDPLPILEDYSQMLFDCDSLMPSIAEFCYPIG